MYHLSMNCWQSRTFSLKQAGFCVCALLWVLVGSAAHSSGRKGGPEDVLRGYGIELSSPKLIEALNHHNPLVRGMAAEVLGDRGERSATAALLERLHDESLAVRVAAAAALLNLGNNAGEGLLQETLGGQDNDLAVQAASVLCRHANQAGLATLKHLVEAPEPNRRKMALIALVQCGDFAEGRDLFMRATADVDKSVRLAALGALTERRDPGVIDLLIRALGDDDEVVRFAAHKWLQTLTGQSFGFRPTDKLQERQHAVHKWEVWWAQNREHVGVVGE